MHSEFLNNQLQIWRLNSENFKEDYQELLQLMLLFDLYWINSEALSILDTLTSNPLEPSNQLPVLLKDQFMQEALQLLLEVDYQVSIQSQWAILNSSLSSKADSEL